MRRIAELDGLRGIAAILIVVYHLLGDWPEWFWASLDIFFVLSGYLITSIVLEHGSSWGFLRAFYLRRGLRIWPTYFLLLGVLAIVWRDDLAAIPFYATYTQGLPRYWGGEMPEWRAVAHTWTLALEEQFYLVWPPMLLLTGRRWTAFLAVGLVLLSVQARVMGFHWYTLLGRCDGFALGGLLAAILGDTDQERGRKRALCWAVGVGALALLFVGGLAATHRLLGNGGIFALAARATVASFGSFAVVAGVVLYAGHSALGVLRIRPLVYLGTISYGLYLYHYPIFQISASLQSRLGIAHRPLMWLAECLLTAAVAIASWKWIEAPILRLKDRIPYDGEGAKPRAGELCGSEHVRRNEIHTAVSHVAIKKIA